jgi:hypothetical protein
MNAHAAGVARRAVERIRQGWRSVRWIDVGHQEVVAW